MNEMNNREPDYFEKEIERVAFISWTIKHNGNEILIKNEMNSEQLFVNEVCIAQKIRTNFLSALKPFHGGTSIGY